MLAIFHFVVAGLSILSLGFIAIHYMFMRTIFENPSMFKGPHGELNQGPPPQFFAMFIWVYVFFSVCAVLAAVGNLLSGLYIRARKNRLFSLVIAGLDCLQVPFGTVLGVFTIVVLVRDSVRELYEASEQAEKK